MVGGCFAAELLLRRWPAEAWKEDWEASVGCRVEVRAEVRAEWNAEVMCGLRRAHAWDVDGDR